MSFPDDWQFSEQGLFKVFPKDGLASIKSGLKELEAGHYLIRTQTRGEGGKLGNSVWTISDYPMTEKPSSENLLTVKPMTDKPLTENRGQLNNDLLNNDLSKTDRLKNDRPATQASAPAPKSKRFSPPSVEEVREYCRSRKNSVDPQRFVDYYASNGWMVGRNHMKDWKAAVRTWEGRDNSRKQEEENPFLEILREEQEKKYGQGRDSEDYVTV